MKKLISVLLAVLILTSVFTMGFSVFAVEEGGDPIPGGTFQIGNETVYTPAEVTDLTADSVRETSLTLNWSPSEYATKYIIYRAVETDNGTVGDYKERASVLGNDNTKYSETGLKAGRIYKYQVVACRVADEVQTFSDPISIVIMTKPKTVAAFKVKSKTDKSVTLKWSSVAFSTNYLLYRSDQKNDGTFTDFKLIETIKSGTTSYTDKNLSDGRIYRYKIYVQRVKDGIDKCGAGKGLRTATILSTPGNFANKKSTFTSLTLSWSKVERADKYELYRKTSNGSYKKIKTLTKTTYKDKDVEGGANYTYKVRAVRKDSGKVYYSKFAKLTSSTAVSSVKKIKTKSYLNRALLTWSSVNGATGYDIYIKKGDNYKFTASSDYPRYLSGKLKTDKIYSFSVKAYKTVNGEKIYGTSKYADVTISSKAYGKTPSGSWIEVCVETQTLYMYVKNKLYLSTPVVTGNAYGGLATTRGYHTIMSKSSNTILKGSANGTSWETFVNYWLGFTYDGQGVHDAPWRSSYGGEIYKGNGSHGCVNTPFKKMKKVYSKAYTGMPVIVY